MLGAHLLNVAQTLGDQRPGRILSFVREPAEDAPVFIAQGIARERAERDRQPDYGSGEQIHEPRRCSLSNCKVTLDRNC